MSPEQPTRKKTWIKILLLIFILALIIFSLLLLLKTKTDKSKNLVSNKENKNCQSNPSPKFTANFTDLSKVSALGILGGMIGGSPGRSYISIKDNAKVPIYAPGDVVLETIVYADRPGDKIEGEYGLYFKASCEVTFLLDHIEELTPEFRALAPQEPQESTATQLGSKPNKQIKAGTLIGYTTGTDLAHTFDFQLLNTSKKAQHINDKRWTWEPTVYADCPYDYYEGQIKAEHYKLLGEPANNNLIPAGNCGQLSKDIAGTASGGWFQNGSNTNEGKWLSLGKNYDFVEFSIRENGRHIFQVKDFQPKNFPDQIKPGNSACYQSYENKWAYINLTSADKLSVATGEGKCPSTFPSLNLESWER